jgi:hypothetical protein
MHLPSGQDRAYRLPALLNMLNAIMRHQLPWSPACEVPYLPVCRWRGCYSRIFQYT